MTYSAPHRRDPNRSTNANVRPAVVSDADALLSLKRELARETPYLPLMVDRPDAADQVAEEIASSEAGERAVFLAALDDALVGFASVSPWGAPPVAHVGTYHLAVLERAQGHGLGRALIERAEAWGADRELSKFVFPVVSANVAAARLYLALGYRFEGVRRDTYRIGDVVHDEYLMGKTIGPPAGSSAGR